LVRAVIAAIISLVGTTLLLRFIPNAQTYRDDIIALAIGGAVWAAITVITLQLAGSALLRQLRSRIG
jgi:hypothetical protein